MCEFEFVGVVARIVL